MSLQQQQSMSNSISNSNVQYTNTTAAINNTIQSTNASLSGNTIHSSNTSSIHQKNSNNNNTTKPLYAACQITPGSEYILCKILFHDTFHKTFKLCDEDIESTNKSKYRITIYIYIYIYIIFCFSTGDSPERSFFLFYKSIVFDLPESQVIVLHSLDRLSKGDTIYAVYPDTTSFYQAIVVQVPNSTRKQQQSSSSLAGQEQFIMVQFIDDADEFGITHDKAVPIQHIILPPP
jgi:hypothetical protein